jgi:hypothetical protein
MGPVVPILIVIIFWMILGVFALTIFRRWLLIPTEAEMEAEHESHATEAKEEQVERAAAH